ncbi:MAG: protein kinase domain-containing protein [Myxococcaceae bacterium]
MSTVRYQALGPLMSGEGSRAFLGLEISGRAPARPVVMIWVPSELAKDAEQRAQIVRETQHAVTLDHPNVMRVYGVASLDGGLARVVEFADGESLRRVLEVAHRLPPHFAARVLCDTATGLHFAHLAGNDDGTPLLHGDVRPETVMLTFSGFAKVAGYGALSVAPKEADGKRVRGRRQYCAPEQIIGGRGAVSVQTDVYSLGALLYECLTGNLPFHDETDFWKAVVEKALPLDGVAEIPEAFVPVLKRAMSKRASDRYPTALAFREALEQAAGTLPSHQELSGYLQAYFPETDPARVARRQTVDQGLADHARKVWEQQGGEPDAVPTRAPEPSLAPTLTNGKSHAAAVSRPAPIPRHTPAFGVMKRPPRRVPAWAFVVGLIGIAGGALYLGSQMGQREEAPAPRATSETSAPTPTAANSPASSAASPGPALVALPNSPAMAPTPGAQEPSSLTPPRAQPAPDPQPVTQTAPEPEAAPLPQAPAEPPRLALTTDPIVEVSLNGRKLGKTPLNLALASGRHNLRLTTADGLNIAKTIAVGRRGVTKQHVVVGKGLLSVNVPNGAQILLDGRPISKVTIKDYPVYEGQHRLLVTLGSAEWRQSFFMGPNETMEYDVEAERR